MPDPHLMYYTDQLQSPRLTTRFVTLDDVAVWTEYCADPVATTFTALPDKTPEQMAQFVIDTTLKRYADGRGGLQALISKDTGAFIGQCGLFSQEVNGIFETEVGYHLIPRYWGMGYATEAAQMFRNYAFENYPLESIVSIIHPMNVASKKVALRNGMHLTDPDADFRGTKYELYRITRKEWEKLNG
jgi:RimJ/RimL family protein N-acetyltransferase